MPFIVKNNIIYASAPTESSILANYVTDAELEESYGLVDNTADNQKSVLYSQTAGDASTVNNHTIASDVPSGAVYTDTLYSLTQDESDGHILYFTPVGGSATTLVIPDNDTTYDSLSDFSNDCGFITNVVSDLTNYYTKSSTYTKTEVNQLISAVPHFTIAVVPDLNIQSPSTTTIYLVPNSGSGTNVYDEYVYVYDTSTSTGTFEKLGTQSIDLTQYYTKTQTDTLLAGKGDNILWNAGSKTLQLKSGSTVLSSVNITGGSTVIHIGDVTGAQASTATDTISLTWTDPEDVVVSGVTLAEWGGTKVIRKVGSAPQDSLDGILIANSTVHNAYSSTPLTDTGLEFGTTYYYRFFPYTVDQIETTGSSVSATPQRETITNIPSQSGTLTYDGTLQTAVFNNYDSNKMTVTGNTGTNADTYTATFTPKTGYQWSDTTLTGKDVSWTIDKATGGATLSSDTVTVDSDHLTATVTISNPTGTVGTPTTSDATVATVSLSGSTLTISSVNETSGDATISIPIAASSNYNAATVTISVTADFLKIVTWAGGTDQEICAMVAAADAGEIDLTEYWSVGNERTVHLDAMTTYPSGISDTHAAQDVVLVLVAKDTGVDDSSNPCYHYQSNGWFYPTHSADAAPNSSNVWADNGTPINPYDTEDGFLSYFPDELKASLITVSKTTALNTVTDGGGSETVSSKVFLLSTTEVGLANENNIAEGYLYTGYYAASSYSPYRDKNIANEAAKGNYSSASGTWSWWLRTPTSTYSMMEQCVKANGKIGGNQVNLGYHGVSPAFVIPSTQKVSTTVDSDNCYVLDYTNTSSNTVSSLAVGSLVKAGTIYNNEEIIWAVIGQDHDGTNTTTLQSRDIITLKCFDAKEPNNTNAGRRDGGNNRYRDSNLLQWLNSSMKYKSNVVRAYPSFIFQQKNCLNTKGKIDSVATNAGLRGWDGCPRRTWCNNQYKSAFPSTFLPAIKQVKVKSWAYTDIAQISEDYFFLASEKEIQGVIYYAVATEGNILVQWPHYTTASNKMKKVNGSNNNWWLRSPYYGDPKYWSCTASSGTATGVNSYDDYGIAVCGCI